MSTGTSCSSTAGCAREPGGGRGPEPPAQARHGAIDKRCGANRGVCGRRSGGARNDGAGAVGSSAAARRAEARATPQGIPARHRADVRRAGLRRRHRCGRAARPRPFRGCSQARSRLGLTAPARTARDRRCGAHPGRPAARGQAGPAAEGRQLLPPRRRSGGRGSPAGRHVRRAVATASRSPRRARAHHRDADARQRRRRPGDHDRHRRRRETRRVGTACIHRRRVGQVRVRAASRTDRGRQRAN
jgi:hypothetical protein